MNLEVTGKLYIVDSKFSTKGNRQYQCVVIDKHDNVTTFWTKPDACTIEITQNKTKTVTVKLKEKKLKYYFDSLKLVHN